LLGELLAIDDHECRDAVMGDERAGDHGLADRRRRRENADLVRAKRVEGLLLNLRQHATKHVGAGFKLRPDVDHFETASGIGHDALHIGQQSPREMQ
jgi:hypothetical protein